MNREQNDQPETLHSLSFRILEATSIEELSNLAESSTVIEYSPADSSHAREHFELRLFERARALTAGDPIAAMSFMEHFLFPILFSNDQTEVTNMRQGIVRDVLKEWAEQYESVITDIVRNFVLDRILPVLRSSPSTTLIRAVVRIGWLRADVSAFLWELIQRQQPTADSTLQDAAAVAIASFPLSNSEGRELAQMLLNRSRHSLSIAHLQALGWIAKHLSTDQVTQIVALSERYAEEDAYGWNSALAWLLSSIARARVDDDIVQRAVLKACLRQARDPNSNMGFALRLEVWSECRLPVVPSALLQLATNQRDLAQATPRGMISHTEHLWLLRAEECLYTPHLRGWRDHQTVHLAREYLHVVATQSTGSDNRSRMETEGNRHKKQLWRFIMRCGIESATNWIDTALRSEPAGFAKHDVLKLAAGLPFSDIPDSVAELLLTSAATVQDSYSRDSNYFAQSGAIECAQLIISRKSFDAILRTTLHSRGYALTTVASALVTVASELAKLSIDDKEFVTTGLIERLGPDGTSWQKPSAARALTEILTEFPGHESTQILWRLFQDFREQRSDISEDARRYIAEFAISALGRQGAHLSSEMTTAVEALSRDDDTDLGWRAADALLTLELWNSETEVLWAKIRDELGSMSAGSVRSFPGKSTTNWALHCVGRLYQKDPGRALPILQQVLREDVWLSIEQLQPHIVAIFAASKRRPSERKRLATSTIAQMLFERARTNITAYQAETAVISILAEAHQPTLRTLIIEYSQSWIPSARVSAAVSLRQASAQPITIAGIRTLIHLCSDEVDEVRDSAIESLACVSPAKLATKVIEWMSSEDWRLRRRAVLAASYLSSNDFTPSGAEIGGEWTRAPDPVEAGESDSDPRIRHVALQAVRDRARRTSVREAIAEIAGGLERGMRVVDLWHFGDCVSAWGDVSHAEQLQSLLKNEESPPRTRWWLIGLAKAIRTRHEKSSIGTNSELPIQSTHVINRRGWFTFSGGRLACSITIWRSSTLLESKTPLWGGSISLDEPNRIGTLAISALEPESLSGIEIDSGAAALVRLKFVTGNLAIFAGDGPCPTVLVEGAKAVRGGLENHP